MSIFTLKNFSVKVKDEILLDKWNGSVEYDSDLTEEELPLFIGGAKQYALRIAVSKGFAMPMNGGTVRITDLMNFIEENTTAGGGLGARVRALKAKLFDAIMSGLITNERAVEINSILESDPDEETVKALQEELKVSMS